MVENVRVGAAHQRGDTGHELLHTQRLDHEIIGTGVERGNNVLLLVALAGKQDGQFAAARIAQGAHHLNAAQAGQQQSTIKRSKLSRRMARSKSSPVSNKMVAWPIW